MRNRLPMGIAAVLMTIVAGGTRMAPAREPDQLMTLTVVGGISRMTALGPGRLAASAARQGLRDEVCIALADGQISRFERTLILTDAKKILKPQEYGAFRQSFDLLSPPKPVPLKHSAKLAHKKKSPSGTKPKTSSLAKSSPTPTIPTDVILPDRVALMSGIR